MRENRDSRLLALWEAGPDPLALLAAAETGEGRSLAGLPVGQRDAALIVLHRQLFGPAIEATVACPSCSATAEVTLDAAALLARAGQAAPARVAHGCWELAARPADSSDLAEVAAMPNLAEAARALALRLVTECRCEGREVDPAKAPDDAFAALAEALERADPLAAIALDLACPECGAAIAAVHDPALHLAQSISAHAHRLLAEVAMLARAYGWCEADILAMSAQRRAAYLELAA